MHALRHQLAGHDQPRPVESYRIALAEEVMCRLVRGKDDERLAAHAEVRNGPVLLPPVVEVKPLQTLLELVDVADQGSWPGPWGEWLWWALETEENPRRR